MSGFASTASADPVTHTEAVASAHQTASTGAVRPADTGAILTGIRPNGNDTWKFAYELDLTFSDGSFVPTFNPSVVLSQSGRTWVEPIQF